MNVRNDPQAARLADVPQLAEVPPIESDVTPQARRVQVVEVLDVGDAPRLWERRQQKRTGFAPAFTSPAKLSDQRAPLAAAQFDKRASSGSSHRHAESREPDRG